MRHLEGQGNCSRHRPRAAYQSRAKAFFVVLAERRVLLLLARHGVADHQALDIGAHKTAKGVLRRAHDRLAAHIESGIDDCRAAREIAEALKQSMINRVGVAVHSLNTRRVVDVVTAGISEAKPALSLSIPKRACCSAVMARRWLLTTSAGWIQMFVELGVGAAPLAVSFTYVGRGEDRLAPRTGAQSRVPTPLAIRAAQKRMTTTPTSSKMKDQTDRTQPRPLDRGHLALADGAAPGQNSLVRHDGGNGDERRTPTVWR